MNKPEWLPVNAHDRAREKTEIVFDWLVRFHYSNAAILMQLLGLNHAANLAYFRKLVSKGLLKSVDVSTVRKPVLMLSAAGLSMLENNPLASRYNWDERRIAASLTRHHLAVQVAVLNRREKWDAATPERLIKEVGRKIPDAVIAKDGIKTALEIELNYKSKQQIYIGLIDHIKAIRDGKYSRVEYVFTDETMRNYYRSAFDESEWPIYRWDEKAKRYKQDTYFDAEKTGFLPQVLDAGSIPEIKETFDFVTEGLQYE
ncbi:hypothetical protein EGT07_23700 [Herbaspirillum sp. HC18]|nr:hypothetical protein EGT07_23700 [Herbaspirillum sp. HC18]